MADIYVVDFGGDDDGRARRAAERDAERNRLYNRYSEYLTAQAVIDEPTARRIVAALFDHHDTAGHQCHCSCHPRLSSQHGDGFDCPCTWDEARRTEATRQWAEFWDSEEASEPEAEQVSALSLARRPEKTSIVGTISDQLLDGQCDHAGAQFYCPKCGRRMAGPSDPNSLA